MNGQPQGMFSDILFGTLPSARLTDTSGSIMPTIKTAGAFLLASCCTIAPASAEDAPYAEYRYLRELGQIQISTGFLERTPDLASRLSRLERVGIVVLEADRERTVTRRERIGDRRVETIIVIKPPVGHGEGGASSNVDVRMVVDGKARVECALWAGGHGLDRIVLEPDRGFVMVNGHDGVLRFDGFEARGMVDDDWLASRAEFVRTLLVASEDRVRKR